MADKVKFGTKIGLIAATVGSAVGLGNVWRFPAETQTNGGAAFLIIYILCVFLLGIPVMLTEFSLGRGGQSDAVGVFKKFSPKTGWWLTGLLAIIASYMILCFYMVVAGWTFEYLCQSVSGALYENSVSNPDASFHQRMEEYICGSTGPVVNTFIMILVNLGVLMMGVNKGIEKLSNILMPLLFILLLIFAGVSLSLPGATEGLEFFLRPDFSKITPSTFISALGQAFFSLSLGMGILITYSAYYPHDTKLCKTAVTVSLLDLLVAVLMGLIIFPAVTSFGLSNADLRGTTLIFVTLPEVFANMDGTRIWSALFFLLLTVAALTSTISIAEVSVSFVQDRFKKGRRVASLIVLLPLFFFSTICALSFGQLSGIRIAGLGIFDFLDTVATNILLPVVSLFTCVFIGWFAPKTLLKDQLSNDGTIRSRLYPVIYFIIRYIAPFLILIVLISSFV